MKKSNPLLLILLCGLILLGFSNAQEAGDETNPPDSQAPPDEPPPGEPQGPQQPNPPEMPGVPPDFSPPQGCTPTPTPTGTIEMKCALSASEETAFEEFGLKNQIDSCSGQFDMENGIPSCKLQGTEGFMGTVCPTETELSQMKSQCNETAEEFSDPRGCKSVACKNNDFKQEFDQAIANQFAGDPLKAQAIQCQKNGGSFVLQNDISLCVNPLSEKINVPDQLGIVSQQQLEQAASKLDTISEKIDTIVEKLGELKQTATPETQAVFEQGLDQLTKTQQTIESLQAGLEKPLLTETERKSMLRDIQQIQQTLLNVATGVSTGKIPTEDEIKQRIAEQFNEWYGRPFTQEQFNEWKENEKTAIEKVRNCGQYTETISFVPPDPDKRVVEIELKSENNHCRMTLHLASSETAQYELTQAVYAKFNGPDALLNQSCSGSGCEMLKQAIGGPHGTTDAQLCTEKCVNKDCELGHFACMEQNLTKCETECGLRQADEGPIGPDGQIDNYQACIMLCVQDAGGDSMACGPGATNPICNQCEEQCQGQYGGGIGYEHCLTGVQVEQKQQACQAAGQYGEPIQAPTPDGQTCISDISCKAFEPPGDDPGSGPGITGQTILSQGAGLIEQIADWITERFR